MVLGFRYISTCLVSLAMLFCRLRVALCILGGAVLGIRAQQYGVEQTPSLFPLMENADSADLFPMPPCGDFQLEEATIDQMQEAMANGTLTSQQLVLCYMVRTYQTEDYIK